MKKNGSLKSIVYDALIEAIVRGEYRPEEILNEGRLEEKFGFSRAPIREALAALCDEGILKNLPRCGYEVVRITMDDIRNMLQFRRILEGGLMEDISRNLTPMYLSILRELADKCNRSGDSMWDHWENNACFHLKLIAGAKNEYAVRQLQHTLSLLKCAYGQHYWDKWDYIYPKDMACHGKILDALEQHSPEEAAHFLALDLEDFAVFA